VRLHASSTFITIGWDKPIYNGGTTITSYNILWDAATSGLIYSQIATVELADSTLYTFQEGIIVGKVYRFKVTANNWIGESEPS
jgi:hypothetical protein